MNKVTLICESFFPERTAGSNRALSIAKTMLDKDVALTIIFLKPQDKVFDQNLLPDFFQNKLVNFYSIPRTSYKKSSLLSRFYHEILLAKKLIDKANSFEADLVIVSMPMLMLLPVSSRFLKVSNAKKVLEIRDLIWRYYEFKTGLFAKVISKLLTHLSISSFNNFDNIVTVTNGQRLWIEKHTSVPVVTIENGIDTLTLGKLASHQSSNVTENSILYAGSIGFPQNLSVLVQAVYKLTLENTPVSLSIIGDGPEYESIKALIASLGLKTVKVLPSQDFDTLLDLYSSHRILYGQLRDIPSLETAIPTKIFEYLALNKIVVFGARGDVVDVLKNFNNVYIVEPDNPDELAITLKKALSESGSNIDNLAVLSKNYIRENLISSYHDFLV